MVNVSWHPSRARCAVSVGRRVFLVDGVTGATLSCVRLPSRTSPSRTPPSRSAPRSWSSSATAASTPRTSTHPARPSDASTAPPSTSRSAASRRTTDAAISRSAAPRRTRGSSSPSGRRHTPRRVLRGPAAGLDALGGGGSSGDHASLTSGSAGSSFGDGPGGDRRAPPRQPRRPSRVAWASSGVRADAKILPCFASAANTKNPSRASPGTPPNPSSSPRTSTAGFEPTTSRRKPPSPRSIDPRRRRRPSARRETPTCAAVLDGDDGCVVVVGDVAGRLRAWRADAFVSGADAAFGGAAPPRSADPSNRTIASRTRRRPSRARRVRVGDGRERGRRARVHRLAASRGRGRRRARRGTTRHERQARAISAPADVGVTASRGFGTDGGDGTVARQNQNSSWGFPPLPPAAHRAHIASHPTQPRAAAVAVGVATGANGVESTRGTRRTNRRPFSRRRLPSPSFSRRRIPARRRVVVFAS